MKNLSLSELLTKKNANELFIGDDAFLYQVVEEGGGFVLLNQWGNYVNCTSRHVIQTYHVFDRKRMDKYYVNLRENDVFYVISDFAEVTEINVDCEEEIIDGFWGSYVNNGYAFTTKEFAEEKLKELQVLGKIAKFQDQYDTVKIDWDNLNETKWHIAYSDITDSLWVAESRTNGRILGLTYFGDRQVAKNCIKEFEDELLEYFRRGKE